MLVERIEAEIVHQGQVVTFDAIAGLKFAKETVIELICWYNSLLLDHPAHALC